jgi:hypothetical protein
LFSVTLTTPTPFVNVGSAPGSVAAPSLDVM